MLTCNMDVEERSVWLRATPGAAAMAQPFYCTEAGNFYGRAHFATARTDKDSYILFYTLSGSGLIEQNDQRIELPAGSALLLNCRTPQSYCTAPGQDHWPQSAINKPRLKQSAVAFIISQPKSKPCSPKLCGAPRNRCWRCLARAAWCCCWRWS